MLQSMSGKENLGQGGNVLKRRQPIYSTTTKLRFVENYYMGEGLKRTEMLAG